MQKLINFIKSNITPLIAVISVFLFFTSIYIGYNFIFSLKGDNKAEKIYTLTKKQEDNIGQLKSALSISEQNAKALKSEIERIKADKKAPSSQIIVQAPDVPTATKIVQEKIIDHDSSLPPEALQKADRTVVAHQPENHEYKVGVYKINLKKNWYLGTGVGYNHGKTYIPISAQRNYDKSHAITVQANFDTSGKVQGGQVMWSVGI